MSDGQAHRCWVCGIVKLDVREIQIMPGVRFESPGGIPRTVEPMTRWICEPCHTAQGRS